MKKVFISTAFLMTTVMVPVWGAGVCLAQNDCRTLILARCEKCHYRARICQKLGEKNEKAWNRTVSRMISKGARLSAEEKKTLVKCLTVQAPEIKKICE
ncbi:MAG TPA: hypothetical protein EYP57_07235 [Thermodesulfobacteriaceae bacterium]|nr:hypothetical protein [Thermodesulfobacteriaceae bacterium]